MHLGPMLGDGATILYIAFYLSLSLSILTYKEE